MTRLVLFDSHHSYLAFAWNPRVKIWDLLSPISAVRPIQWSAGRGWASSVEDNGRGQSSWLPIQLWGTARDLCREQHNCHVLRRRRQKISWQQNEPQAPGHRVHLLSLSREKKSFFICGRKKHRWPSRGKTAVMKCCYWSFLQWYLKSLTQQSC